MRLKNYSIEETKYIIDNYKELSIRQIARDLNRPFSSVWQYIQNFGLKRKYNYSWLIKHFEISDDKLSRINKFLGVTELSQPEPEFTEVADYNPGYRNFSTKEIENTIFKHCK